MDNKKLSLVQQKFLINAIPKRLSAQESRQILSYFPDLLKQFLVLAAKYRLIFVIAGSFSATTAGFLQEYSDLDVYICAELSSLIEFPLFEAELDTIHHSEQAYNIRINLSARLNNLKHPTLKISRVLTTTLLSRLGDPRDCSIDFVFAPAEIENATLYGMYVAKSFDLSVCRSVLLMGDANDSSVWSIFSLSTPSHELVSEKRLLKYSKRAKKFNSSSLALLSLNVLLDSQQLSYTM